MHIQHGRLLSLDIIFQRSLVLGTFLSSDHWQLASLTIVVSHTHLHYVNYTWLIILHVLRQSPSFLWSLFMLLSSSLLFCKCKYVTVVIVNLQYLLFKIVGVFRPWSGSVRLSIWRLQCLFVCLWSNKCWKNIHNDGNKCKTMCMLLGLRIWAR